ncbi:MAG: hypothetical protein K0M50_20545 [Prolixibacteraceae bacterium]|nr:hypothetical protein [Prolixibacteraceae bacterium]
MTIPNDITEHKIQTHIWDNREKFVEFMIEPQFPDEIEITNPSFASASEILYNKFLSIVKKQWQYVQLIELFGVEVPLKKDENSTIRADFLGIAGGANGLAIIELKKSRQTERQAFTELYAYGNHLRTKFMPMSKSDIFYILISPMEERIVIEASLQNFFFDRTNFFALIPKVKKKNDEIIELRLEPWIPSFEEFGSILDYSFSEKNFDVFKVAWQDLPDEWNPRDSSDPDIYMIERMNKVSSYAAQVMESRGIHGFVYTSQTWSELKDALPLTNSLIVVGINPYKATKNRFLINGGLDKKSADKVGIESISFLDIIPELKSKAAEVNEKFNYLCSLSESWANEITFVGLDIVKTLTKSTRRPDVQKSYNSFDWEIYQQIFLEDISCHNFDLRPTGLIRELWFDYSKLDYDYMRVNGTDEHLQYSADYSPEFIEIVSSQHFVREFIRRLYSPFYEDEYYEDFDD